MAKFQYGGGYFGVNFGHLKSEVFHFLGPFLENLDKNLLSACASEIVSHILRMWRLIKAMRNTNNHNGNMRILYYLFQTVFFSNSPDALILHPEMKECIYAFFCPL